MVSKNGGKAAAPITPARWKNRITGTDTKPADWFLANPENWRIHPIDQQAVLSGVLDEVGWVQMVMVNQRTSESWPPAQRNIETMVDGHLRVTLALREGDNTPVPMFYVDLDPNEEALVLATLDPIGALAATAADQLNNLLDKIQSPNEALQQFLDSMPANYGALIDTGEPEDKRALAKKTLQERFLVPPFSVLDARQGYWQKRKNAWIDLGIKGELGRDGDIVPNGSSRPADQDGVWMRSGGAKKNPNLTFVTGAERTDETSAKILASGRKKKGDGLIGFSENARSHYKNKKNSPGGSPRPSASLGPDGKTQRGDGRGRPIGVTYGSGAPGELGRQYNHVHGVLMKSDSGNDPAYYFKKQAVEKKLGREISTEEFQRFYYEGPDTYQGGTSIFDPVLCEVVYRWFNSPGGAILDPFAGESTKGIVASVLGYPYAGVELRQEQVDANLLQWADISSTPDLSGETVSIKVSAKSARELWNGCQLEYIKNTCKGRCCSAGDGTIHIPVLPGPEEEAIAGAGGVVTDGMLQGKDGGGCVFQDKGLCSLHDRGIKPIACTLSPFTLNAHNTLIVKNRNRKLICYKKEPNQQTYKAYKTALINMFGQEEADRITSELDSGAGDFIAQMPADKYRAVKWIINKQRASLGMEEEDDIVGAASETAPGSLMTGPAPKWICGDSEVIDNLLPAGEKYDLVFTSPPYYDLEIYSQSEKDGSAFETYEKFMNWYKAIFKQVVDRMNDNRFLVVKVGEIRNRKTGQYRNFVGDNISCFLDLGLHYYNEMILVTAIGSLSIRVGKQFSATRKIGKTHQNILVFYKGDLKKIKSEFPDDIEYLDISSEENPGPDNS